jgi:hypothetical protein
MPRFSKRLGPDVRYEAAAMFGIHLNVEADGPIAGVDRKYDEQGVD